MTKTCPECGLSLQGRDNESDTCSDCLLGLTDEQYKETIIMKLTDKQKQEARALAHNYIKTATDKDWWHSIKTPDGYIDINVWQEDDDDTWRLTAYPTFKEGENTYFSTNTSDYESIEL